MNWPLPQCPTTLICPKILTWLIGQHLCPNPSHLLFPKPHSWLSPRSFQPQLPLLPVTHSSCLCEPQTQSPPTSCSAMLPLGAVAEAEGLTWVNVPFSLSNLLQFEKRLIFFHYIPPNTSKVNTWPNLLISTGETSVILTSTLLPKDGESTRLRVFNPFYCQWAATTFFGFLNYDWSNIIALPNMVLNDYSESML